MTDETGMGLSSREYWSLSAFAVACVMLVVINISYSQGNRDLREKVTQRQLFINQSVALEKTYKQLVKGIAQVAVRNQDDELKKLLADQGIEIRVNNGNGTNGPGAQ